MILSKINHDDEIHKGESMHKSEYQLSYQRKYSDLEKYRHTDKLSYLVYPRIFINRMLCLYQSDHELSIVNDKE